MRKGSKIVAFVGLTRRLSCAARALGLAGLVAAVGCAPELGDSCNNNTDCSIQGDRQCDRSAPGGYCTIPDCVAGACKGEGYCVRFEPDQLRLSEEWCMAKCGRGCRNDYRCATVDELNAERCGMTADEYRRLDALGGDREGDDQAAWRQVQRCIRNEPRVAEVLDRKQDAEFCVQPLTERE